MKKIIFATISFVALSFLNANAAGEETQKSVNLTVKLHLIQSLQVNSDQTNVLLEYKTKEDYQNGVSVTENNHLTVYSTGGFTVQAQSSAGNFEGPKPFETKTVKLSAIEGAGEKQGTNYTAVELTNAPTTLIKSATGASDRKFNVIYSGAKNDTYLDFFENNAGSPNQYTTTVTYTITPQ